MDNENKINEEVIIEDNNKIEKVEENNTTEQTEKVEENNKTEEAEKVEDNNKKENKKNKKSKKEVKEASTEEKNILAKNKSKNLIFAILWAAVLILSLAFGIDSIISAVKQINHIANENSTTDKIWDILISISLFLEATLYTFFIIYSFIKTFKYSVLYDEYTKQKQFIKSKKEKNNELVDNNKN